MNHGVAFVLVAGTVTLAELVGHKLDGEAWLVVPLTLVAAGAGAAAVELGRQMERRRRNQLDRTLAETAEAVGELFTRHTHPEKDRYSAAPARVTRRDPLALEKHGLVRSGFNG